MSSHKKPGDTFLNLLGLFLNCITKLFTWSPNFHHCKQHLTFCHYMPRTLPSSRFQIHVSHLLWALSSNILKVQVSTTVFAERLRCSASLPTGKFQNHSTFSAICYSSIPLQIPIPIFIFYCCITNSHKFSNLKQHTWIMSSFLWVRGLGMT